MTKKELDRLEALAKAATSGPWARHPAPGAYAVHQPEFECWIPQDGNDADFIAEANPNTILSLIRLARVGLAVTPRPIDEAPKDGLMFLAYSQDLSGNGLTPFWSGCAWHEDAGFCTDEIREPTHFIHFSSLPKPGGE